MAINNSISNIFKESSITQLLRRPTYFEYSVLFREITISLFKTLLVWCKVENAVFIRAVRTSVHEKMGWTLGQRYFFDVLSTNGWQAEPTTHAIMVLVAIPQGVEPLHSLSSCSCRH